MGNIPDLNSDQMREVDRAMIEDVHIQLIQMMENAGRNLAHLARTRFLQGDPREQTVLLLAGRGGNGGGALVCARRLHNWGADVQVFIAHPIASFNGVTGQQLDILQRMNIPVTAAQPEMNLPPADMIIDGLIGYSLSGAPLGTAATLIQAANNHPAPILSLDIPSGLDTTTGVVYRPCIQATATMTLALPKEGLKGNEAVVGELYLADISVPPGLYAGPGLELNVGPIFSHDDIIRLW
ncbi:MAG: NAD(P)H-hydrate epimerase [Chloroflexi bacterium]|nr:NAD(P)H-hydrate epimerase [Chloroflexota bacterium]